MYNLNQLCDGSFSVAAQFLFIYFCLSNKKKTIFLIALAYFINHLYDNKNLK